MILQSKMTIYMTVKKRLLISLLLVFLGIISYAQSNKEDEAFDLEFKNKDTLVIISTNSADIIYNVKGTYNGDSIIISFKRGFVMQIFRKSDNELPLKGEIKYIRCGNRIWKVVKSKIYPYVTLKRVKKKNILGVWEVFD
jgi:hypothetical protein